MEKPHYTKDNIHELLDRKFVRVYDIEYEQNRHYYSVSRRSMENIHAAKTEEELRNVLPDAISCFLIIETPEHSPRLVTFYEYRYPTGQFVLSIPSGLIDPDDGNQEEAIRKAVIREIHEETGIALQPGDRITVINNLCYNTPGLTDESTALVCVVCRLDDLSSLSQAGAEGSEVFDGFVLLEEEDARRILKNGCDDHGTHYPMVTWAAMTYFTGGFWKED